MVLNAAVQMLREADDLKLKISKFKIGTSMLQDRNIWVTQQQLQQIYQKVLVLDLDYALDKKVEQDLWNVGFKQQIEALQAISKDRKNPHRSEGQAMLTWVLQAAAGFYLCLLHQICTTFKLDLPFRRRASLLGWAEGWGAGNHTQSVTGVLPPPAAARYISQHCLVHLGDLARYRQQLRVAHTFYRHALLVSAQSGQPYNQLALVARRRGRQLDAIYWHVRSLLVRAPFPPAHTNLATTLAAAANTRTRENLPVIPGITSQPASEQNATTVPSRLDAHNYVEEFIKAVHIIHTLEDLDAASQLVNVLNSSLTPLVATDSFECMTLIKLGCVVMWLIHTNTEGLTLDSSQLTEGEYRAGNMSLELAAGSLLALLLPAYTRELNKPAPSLPALKVWLQWLLAFPSVLKSAALVSRPQLWAALAHTLNQLCEYTSGFDDKIYATLPLPEDEELHGFLPLESAFSTLKFTNYASWDTYGDRLPAYHKHQEEEGQDEDIFTLRCPSDMTEETLSKQPELEQKIRACRIINIGIVIAKQIETNGHDHFTVVKEEDRVSFNTSNVDSEELTAALYELSVQQTAQNESDELPPPPIIISEADFREKVREKRVGILKPQGSLERAREERALATQDDQDVECDDTSGDEAKKECRKARMNVAMAAIMRKQEETNKQVKFVTPATTPDMTSDVSPPKEDKLKILQPKAIKSLADIPVGRKTGGILSLKDRSAGYPHLVNAEPENKVIIDEDKKHDVKSQTIQNPPKLSQEHIMPNRMPNFIPRPSFQPKTVYPKINFNSSYQPNNNVSNQGIRLPVVNPKEIDVRSAAVQKQNSRQDLFQDGPKFNYQNMSGDKKNFLNDLPPRFANQYKYWQQQNNQNDNHFNTNQDNKFSDDNFRTNLQANHNWTPTGQQEYPQPTWWKLPENFNTNYSPMNFQPNYYQANLSPNFQSSPNYTQSDNATSTNYMGNLTQPQLQNLQIPSNFSSPMNSFGTYGGAVGYDSTMYPQFANSSGFPQMKMPEKPSGLNFSPGASSGEPKRVSMFNEPVMKNIEHGPITDRSGAGQGNTYSLFSAQDSGNWAPPQMQQSLWSGPGPSPLERLLEQQKQVKPPNEPQ